MHRNYLLKSLELLQPYFTIAILHPATGFKTFEDHITQLAPKNKAAEYGLVPIKNWHLSANGICKTFSPATSLTGLCSESS